MKIIWWNLGRPFDKNALRQLIERRWNCFFQPKHGDAIQRWLRVNLCDCFMGCEVVQQSDTKALVGQDVLSDDWVVSPGHSHGRVVVSNHSVDKVVVDDAEFVTEWYGVGGYYIAPVHLHWSKPQIRLAQARSLVRAASTLDKPVIIVGDFNIWMLFGRWFLFGDDKRAFQLLAEHFVEVTHAIHTTMIVPFVKLDYVFACKKRGHAISVRSINQPVRGADHVPLEICINE
jgi:hypothetical protein